MSRFLNRILIITAVILATLVAVGCVFLLSYHRSVLYYLAPSISPHPFAVQSIDTMKHSRDMAEQVLDTPRDFQSMIDGEMSLIAGAGATHVALGTPYDAHFLPVLKLWVASARAHGLSVWFRGNFSGWEGWFNYPKIDRPTHEQMLKDFIHANPDLFKSGDVFTPCPECENGGSGDPRQTGDKSGYNAFLVDEERIAATEFALQGKYVAVYPSMNADIARQSISPSTVAAFGGTILIDHYVSSVAQFTSDISAIPKQLNANVGLGEVGAPIPDLNGDMTQAQQAKYIDSLFNAMYQARDTIPVVNYWTLTDSSTKLINDDGTPREAYTTVQNYFKAYNAYGLVYNSLGESVGGVEARIDGTHYHTTADGTYQLFVPRQYSSITIEAPGYSAATLEMPTDATTTLLRRDVHLKPIAPDWWYETRAYLYKTLRLD
ncbi:MAG: hypothetical protein RLZZ26_633 [Candidatus Parcubacteria bacterium]|jgi:hypothetical protein